MAGVTASGQIDVMRSRLWAQQGLTAGAVNSGVSYAAASDTSFRVPGPEHVAADPDRVFTALADPEGLAQFVPQLTSIRHGDGDRVDVEARYEGRTQRGEAYFRVDEDARKVEWGTGSGYRGWMQVIADGDGSMLTLGLHTTHVERADHDVAATLDAIRRLVESTV